MSGPLPTNRSNCIACQTGQPGRHPDVGGTHPATWVLALDQAAIERDPCDECGMRHGKTIEYRFRYLGSDQWVGWLEGRRTSEDDGHTFYLFARHRKRREPDGRTPFELSVIPVDPWNVIGPVDGPDAP